MGIGQGDLCELAAEIDSICARLVRLSDHEFLDLWKLGTFDRLLKSIGPPTDGDAQIYQWFITHRTRLQLIAQLHTAICQNYCQRGHIEGRETWVSPMLQQWFDGQAMILQGAKPFDGGICKFDGKELSFALAARDIEAGGSVGPGDLQFVSMENAAGRRREFLEQYGQNCFRDGVDALRSLLVQECNVEGQYQELLLKFPWLLSLQFRSIQRHAKLDNRNIPDFTGVRAADGNRDIVEVKPPFMPVFRGNSRKFSTQFLSALDQAERYLEFCRSNSQYLEQEKGWRFHNPECILICGYGLAGEQARLFYAKRKNSIIRVVTFDELLMLAEHAAELLDGRREVSVVES